MADSMLHAPWLRAEVWGNEMFCGGRVHLGILNPQPQPLVSNNGLTRVWFDGEYLPPSTATGAALTAENMAEIVSGSGEKVADLDGAFNLACFDSRKEEVLLANDRLGFRPLYYMETEDWFAYAGEVKALLAICEKLPDLDEIGLRQFFGFDHMLGERTWWKGIEMVPPASVWRISATGHTLHQYWTFDEIRRNPQKEADVQIEFSRLWSEDVRRRVRPGTMPILLSGGQDSRLLVAELETQGADLVALTFGSRESPDMRIARRVAATAGIRHRPCYLHTENWWKHRDEAIWQTDGLINGFNLQVAIAMEDMRTGNGYSLINIAGDLLFGGSHLDKNAWVDGRSVERLLEPRYIENPFFSPDEVLSVSTPDARRYLDGPSSDCFHLRQRMRRFTLHGPGCLAPYSEIVFPGLSRALLQLALGSLSDNQRIGHKFYNPFLATYYPRYYAEIPWQVTGRGLAESPSTRFWRDHIGWRLERFVGKRAKCIRADQWFVNYPECVDKSGLREKLLREDLIADQFLQGAARRALTDGEGGSLSAQQVVAILTFETYLRQTTGMRWLRSLSRDTSSRAAVN